MRRNNVGEPDTYCTRAGDELDVPINAVARPLCGLSALLGLIVAFAVNPLATAEHEADHRYTVSGYVLNDDRSPIPSTRVSISAGDVGGRGETDADGYYVVRLHLHNSDLGRKLRIRTDHGEAVVRVSFDPDDLTSARVHHANIVGGRLIEGQLDGASRIPVWLYYVAGLGLLIVLSGFLGKQIKRLRKQLLPRTKAKPRKKSESAKSKASSKRRRRR